MQDQKTIDFSLLNGLFSINDKIHYLAVVNIFGEIIYWHAKRKTDSKEDVAERFRKLVFATTALSFDNVKLVMLHKDNLKILAINLEQDTLMIGIDEHVSWSDTSNIINCLADWTS